MANLVTLLHYLQAGPPILPVITGPRGNTTSDRYNADDITAVHHWSDFDWNHIQQTYNLLLNQATIADEPMPQTPAKPVNSEDSVRARFHVYLTKRVERSLAAGFTHLQTTSTLPPNTTILSFGETSAARPLSGGFRPDTATYEIAAVYGTGPNRAPGEMKPSYKWSSNMANQPDPIGRDYKQALSQLNFYMLEHRTRYGFICTDREMVAVRRVNDNGELDLSDPIAWNTRGNVNNPQMTVLLAIWYLAMLASDDLNWFL